MPTGGPGIPGLEGPPVAPGGGGIEPGGPGIGIPGGIIIPVIIPGGGMGIPGGSVMPGGSVIPGKLGVVVVCFVFSACLTKRTKQCHL